MNVVALFPDRPRENGDLVFALHLVAAPPRSIVRPLHSLDAADAVAPIRLCTPLLYRDGSNFSRGGGGAAANPDRSPEPTARGGCVSAL